MKTPDELAWWTDVALPCALLYLGFAVLISERFARILDRVAKLFAKPDRKPLN